MDYSKRKLTHRKDKLIALSGLAHSYYERENRVVASYKTCKGEQLGKYAAGVWEAHMPSTLLWQTRSAQRPLEYRAPSWSWASVDGCISYDSQMISGVAKNSTDRYTKGPRRSRNSFEHDFGAFHVEDIETTTSSLDPLGAISAGHITIRGLLANAKIDEETYTLCHSHSHSPYTIPQSSPYSTYTLLRDPDCLVVGALLPDVQTEALPENIYCVSIRDEQDRAMVHVPWELDREYKFKRVETVMGLGLTMIGEEGDAKMFRRLGLVRWMRKDLFASKESSTIKIV